MSKYRVQDRAVSDDLHECVARLDEQLADIRECETTLNSLKKDRKDLISEIDLQIAYLKSLEEQITGLRKGIAKEIQRQET